MKCNSPKKSNPGLPESLAVPRVQYSSIHQFKNFNLLHESEFRSCLQQIGNSPRTLWAIWMHTVTLKFWLLGADIPISIICMRCFFLAALLWQKKKIIFCKEGWCQQVIDLWKKWHNPRKVSDTSSLFVELNPGIDGPLVFWVKTDQVATFASKATW